MNDESGPVGTLAAALHERAGDAAWRRARSRLLLIVLAAALVRALLAADNLASSPDFLIQDVAAIHAELADPNRPFMDPFGFEASNIAHALVCTDQGYASPFGGATGPTAWIAPGVVGLYAAAFALWGCFTAQAILFTFAVALAASLVATVAVFYIGSRIGGRPAAGLLAASGFAVLPFEAWIFHINGQLDFNLQVLWFALLLLAVLRAMDRERPARAYELGLASSAAALFNPGFVLCTVVVLPIVVRGEAMREKLRLVAVVVLVHAVVVGPYIAWQSLRLGGFVPVKSNGGFELALGNTPGSTGVLSEALFEAHHPSQNLAEFRRYRELGEIAYVRGALESSIQGFRRPDFIRATLRRTHEFFIAYELKPWDHSPRAVAVKSVLWKLPVLSFLLLVLVRRGRLARLELVMLLFTLAYAAPYLVTGIMERYRLPMVTTVAVLLALIAVEAVPSLRRSR